MKNFAMIRYTGDEVTISGLVQAWILGWADLARGLLRVMSLGLLDTDAKLWLKLRSGFYE